MKIIGVINYNQANCKYVDINMITNKRNKFFGAAAFQCGRNY